MPHFWGWRPTGGDMTLRFELGRCFCTMHLCTKFRHPMFNRFEVIMLINIQTNKWMLLKTSTLLCYDTPVEKKISWGIKPLLLYNAAKSSLLYNF